MSKDIMNRVKGKRTSEEKKLFLKSIVMNPFSYLMVLTYPAVIMMGIQGLRVLRVTDGASGAGWLLGMIFLALGMVLLFGLTHLLVFEPYVFRKDREQKRLDNEKWWVDKSKQK